jgi:hypothetical protein
MRKTILASTLALAVVGLVVMSSASCGSSGSGGGGSSGSSGTAGAGGSSGAGGSTGTTGTGGSQGAGGAAGSGGTSGSGMPDASCKAASTPTAGLTGTEFTSACKSCLESKCDADFAVCQCTTGCVSAVDCIATCYYGGKGDLMACGTMCQGDASSSLVTNVTNAVFCAATMCGSSTDPPCPAAK